MMQMHLGLDAACGILAFRCIVAGMGETMTRIPDDIGPDGIAPRGKNWRPADSFGYRLLLVRREMGMSIDEISTLVGYSNAAWSNWENGRAPRNMAKVVGRLHQITGVDRTWLMWGGKTPAFDWAETDEDDIRTGRLYGWLQNCPLPAGQMELPFALAATLVAVEG